MSFQGITFTQGMNLYFPAKVRGTCGSGGKRVRPRCVEWTRTLCP